MDSMTLLNAPVYNEGKEKLKKGLLVGSGILVVALVLLTLAGYISGHGWFFTNLPAEHRVNTFFNALEAKDFGKAYAVYTNDDDWQQHAAAHKDYTEARFVEDWTTESPVGAPVTSHHVDISRTDGTGTFGTGVIVAVTVNKGKRIFMWYQKSDGQLTEPAPHELQY